MTTAAQELLDKRFRLNMSRVNRLIGLAMRIKSLRDYNPDEIADLHRSTVVFLFASFEDTLRTIENIYLSSAENDRKRFGNVCAVVKLIRQLNHVQFENRSSSWVEMDRDDRRLPKGPDYGSQTGRGLGLDIEGFRPLFSEMATLMARRHRIVHKADLVRPDTVIDAPWTIGDDYQTMIWFLLVTGFVSKLHAALDPSALVAQWFAEERTELIKKLTKARQIFLSIPSDKENFERKLQALRDMLNSITEVQAMINRPNDETARAIADKYGIPY